jgi:DNA-binding LacI/PurR family transcriptional regulator
MSSRVDTIADIARLAGVSKSTVSRALNDSPLIGAETKERIRAIADEHEFRINVLARRLSMKESRAVALVTYPYTAEAPVTDAFMLEIIGALTSALHAEDYDLLVIQVDPDDTDWIGRYLETGRADGFIVFSPTWSQRHIDALVELDAPFVVWGMRAGPHGRSSVAGDNVAGGRMATEHLIASGRNRIAFLGGPARDPEVQDRFRGYEAALAAAGRTVDPALVAYGDEDWSERSAAAAMRELLERAPELDAVFVNSDLMALEAIAVAREHGRRIPDDVAVVGYDDLAIARHSDPPLTTVRQNAPLAGRLLAENLVQQLRTGVVTNVSIPAELVVRRSA